MTSAELSPVGPVASLTAEDLEGDLIQPGHPLFGIVWVNRERMSGAPCFSGTRVPIQSLFDHLEAGDSLAVFLDDFPPITKAQAVALLEFGKSKIFDGPGSALGPKNVRRYNQEMTITESEPVGPVKPMTSEDLEGDLIQPGHPLFGIVWANPARMGGAPCFAGSRVPISSLFHYLESGDTIEIFLDSFPPITRAQVVALLEVAQSRVLDGFVTP